MFFLEIFTSCCYEKKFLNKNQTKCMENRKYFLIEIFET